MLTLSLIQQFCSRRLRTYFVKKWKISIIKWITYDEKWKTLWQKEKLLVLSNFYFCHYVFKNLSAAEASKSVYMRERVNAFVGKISMILWKSKNFFFIKFDNSCSKCFQETVQSNFSFCHNDFNSCLLQKRQKVVGKGFKSLEPLDPK